MATAFVAQVSESTDAESTAPPAARRRRIFLRAASALLLAAIGAPLGWSLWPQPPRAMIAVLPFENLSSDPGILQRWLTEEMISVLGNLYPDRLGVIARTSAGQYKKAKKPIDEIGRQLGVSYVVRIVGKPPSENDNA